MKIAILLASSLILILTAFDAGATSRASCQTMVKPMESVASGMRSFYNSMVQADTSKAAEMFTGAEREAFQKMESLRQQLLPLMKAFADQSEDTQYLMQKCAR